MPNRALALTSLLGSLGLAATPALAGDGRIEISQAVVDAQGGFPYVITQSGSYLLTSDLTVTDPDTDAIRVDGDDVSVDLGGFEIRGPSVCSNFACVPTGAGIGIDATGHGALLLRNGTIRGFPFGATSFSGRGRIIHGLTVVSNQFGLEADAGVVRDCVSRDSYNAVAEAVFVRNSLTGESVQAAESVVAANTILGASSEGVWGLDAGAVVSENSIRESFAGVLCSHPSDPRACLVIGNAIDANATSGVLLNGTGGYANNVINDHPAGDPVDGGVNMGGNVCDGSQSPAVCDPL